jgi:hypothetical protein
MHMSEICHVYKRSDKQIIIIFIPYFMNMSENLCFLKIHEASSFTLHKNPTLTFPKAVKVKYGRKKDRG